MLTTPSHPTTTETTDPKLRKQSKRKAESDLSISEAAATAAKLKADKKARRGKSTRNPEVARGKKASALQAKKEKREEKERNKREKAAKKERKRKEREDSAGGNRKKWSESETEGK